MEVRHNRGEDGGEFRRRARRSRLIALLITVVVLALATVLVLRSGFFALDRLAVEGNAVVTEEEIAELVPLGENLLEIDTEGLEARLSEHPFISDAAVEKEYPDKLIVVLEERTPVCWLGGGELLLLGGDAVVLPRAELAAGGFDLPVVQPSDETPRLGVLEHYDNPALIAACALCARMQRQALPIFDELAEIFPTRDHLEARTAGGETILLPMDASPESLAALQAVWSRERLTGIEELDARFRGQIVARGGEAAPPPPPDPLPGEELLVFNTAEQ